MTKSRRPIARALFQDATITDENKKKIHHEFVENFLLKEENYFKERYQIVCRISSTLPLSNSSEISLSNLSSSSALPSGHDECEASSSPNHLLDVQSIPHHSSKNHINFCGDVIDKLINDGPASKNKHRSFVMRNLISKTKTTPRLTSLASRQIKRYRLACIDAKSKNLLSPSISMASSNSKENDKRSSNCENCFFSAVRSLARKNIRVDEPYDI